MNFRLILLIAVAIAMLTAGCDGSSSNICPPMGNITTIDNPESALNVNDLVGSNVPVFHWNAIECKSLQILPKSMHNGEYLGKPVIVVFHKVMNCPGCKYQLPFLQAVYGKWKDRGLIILTIYRGDKPKEMKGYIQTNKIEFIALADPGDIVATKLGFAVGAPMNIFIDKEGTIKAYKIGPLQNEAEIETILKTL